MKIFSSFFGQAHHPLAMHLFRSQLSKTSFGAVCLLNSRPHKKKDREHREVKITIMLFPCKKTKPLDFNLCF